MNDFTLLDIKRIILEEMQEHHKILGFITENGYILPTGLDSKIIGRLFEVLSEPVLKRVAHRLNMQLNVSKKQTLYPDFWLSDPNNPNKDRIAIDIKSTYRKKSDKIGFTLGSYTSFLRNNTKNIDGNYSMYKAHLILGFVYTRSKDASNTPIKYSNKDKFKPSISNVEYFVAEKYKIAGEKPGSGNTANIGSMNAPISNFRSENGPFNYLGEDIFEDYWRNYPTSSERKDHNEKYSDIEGYISWKAKENKQLSQVLEKKYKQCPLSNN